MEPEKSPSASERRSPRSRSALAYLLLAPFVLATLVTTYFLYSKTEQLFRWSLDDRLLTVAAVASTHFRPGDLDGIAGPQSVGSDAYREAVARLQWLRRRLPHVRYAYILRKTENPNTLEFVADADSLTPDVPQDLTGDGVIDEDDALAYPGDPYDVTDLTEFRREAFRRPYVDPDLVHDKWGTFLSGHAPIFDGDVLAEEARYVIGLDYDVSEYQSLKQVALVPFLLFVLFLLIALTALTLLLKRMWESQVSLLAEIDRQKDELLGIIAHQLLNPITAVRWSTENLLSGDAGTLSESQQQEVSTIQGLSTQLTDLVNMILDVSRIQLGRLPITPTPLDLGGLLGEILSVIEPAAKQRGVTLQTTLPGESLEILLDRRYTHMTLENLLSNAVKYTPTGGKVTFTVTAEEDLLRCTVSDTGCGIPRSEQGKIFGKLYRATNVRNTVTGNGFGLYVAKGAVESQGGRIWFESAEGKGTTFHVELPLRRPGADLPPVIPEPHAQ